MNEYIFVWAIFSPTNFSGIIRKNLIPDQIHARAAGVFSGSIKSKHWMGKSPIRRTTGEMRKFGKPWPR